MALDLTAEERAMAAGEAGAGAALALRVLAEAARLLGAERLLPIASAHIDGCLYHGEGGVAFARALRDGGARVAVPATTNVGALDLTCAGTARLDAQTRALAGELMALHLELGCRPTWTCAPYQAGHRPAAGSDVAWGESNAVAFVNSVLGARSNRYGDFLDLACAVAGRAPACGLHLPENRRARVKVDLSALPPALHAEAAFWPVLGAWYGRALGEAVGVIDGAAVRPGEDALKAFGAAAASSGAVALFHVAGVTPEAPDAATALGGRAPERLLRPSPAELLAAYEGLSSVPAQGTVDAVALGSPHLSPAEFRDLARLLAGRRLKVPLYACSGRHAVAEIEAEGLRAELEAAGVRLVVDTCIVVTPVLPAGGGVLMTGSAKFAHYAPGNTGWEVVFGTPADCVESAVAGRVTRAPGAWGGTGGGTGGGAWS